MSISFSSPNKIGRNEPCPCGSGLKFKRCHGDIVKQEQCKQIANLYMLELIEEEKGRAKLINFVCKECNLKFNRSNMIDDLLLCPNCNSPKIEKENINEKSNR